jgi:hypothetical protein
VQIDTLPSAARVEQALAEVYARPEFSVTEVETIWDRINAFLGRVWTAIWDFIGAGRLMEAGGPAFERILMAALVAVALAILFHLIYTAVQGVQPGDRRARGAAAGGGAGTRPRTAAEWDAAARDAAARGRYREAALALYQALLLRMDARGAVRYDPAKTPGDYRREAQRRPEDARTLGTFLRGFEPVAFGGRVLDGDGYVRLRDAAGGGAGA